jgi:ABC-2 type transport system ATP-binding protein
MDPDSNPSPTPALRLAGVAKRYPYFTLGPIDLELAPGATLGLLGENGAGKSTLLRILLGLVRADSGAVEVLGLPMPARELAIKSEVAFVSEDMAPYGGKSIAWNLALVRALAPRWDEARATALLRRFELRPEQRAKGLSRGQTVRLLLLLALVRRPRLLLLDEPTTGLDPRIRHELRQELARAAAEDGTTIVFSSHLTEDMTALASEIVILDRGRIARRAATADLLREGPLERVFLDAIAKEEARRSRRAA